MEGLRPIGCILPPYVLREIARRGTPRQQERAWAAFAVSERLRGHRHALGAFPSLGIRPAEEKRRSVFTAEGTTLLPGKLVRSEGQKRTGDPATDEAYDGAGATYDFYREVFGRDSVDGKGMRLDSTVHFGRDYDNAFWNGRQMVYGDGDGELFQRFTRALDVIGHELTHGVVQFEADLEYQGESGALAESFADVFGALVKQWRLGQTAAEADWLVGKGLFTRKVKGRAIRSMKAPGSAYDDPVLGKDPQPGHLRDLVETTDDNGGVHVNSGIPNRAFYETAVRLGGHAWMGAGRIWYDAMVSRLRGSSTFREAAEATAAEAARRFGTRSVEADAVRAGWSAVGVAAS